MNIYRHELMFTTSWDMWEGILQMILNTTTNPYYTVKIGLFCKVMDYNVKECFFRIPNI